ncbi:MAG: class I SAM-dependent methyltransferase [Sulfobacillus sp.]
MHRDYEMWHDREHLLRLDNPEREQMMPKAPVLEAVDATEGMRVADVGAGLGYFSLPLAVAVGRAGLVLAVDPSPAARDELTHRANAAGLFQLEVMAGSAEDTHLASDSVDRVLWHTMYHEVQHRQQAIAEMKRILRSGGLWIIVDWRKELTEFGPPLEHRFTVDEVVAEVAEQGFQEVSRFQPGPVTWGVVVENL